MARAGWVGISGVAVVIVMDARVGVEPHLAYALDYEPSQRPLLASSQAHLDALQGRVKNKMCPSFQAVNTLPQERYPECTPEAVPSTGDPVRAGIAKNTRETALDIM